MKGDPQPHSPWATASQAEWERVAHASHRRPFVGCVYCARARSAGTAATSGRPSEGRTASR